MKTAYTEYRVVVRDPETWVLCTVPAEDESGADAVAAYFNRYGIRAWVESRDVSQWRAEQ